MSSSTNPGRIPCLPLAFAAFAALSAIAATPEWTGTAWTAPITPAADNILSPAYLETSTYADVAVCDHVYDMNGEFSGNHAIIWNLPEPAFGESLAAGETSSKGEKFLWTYDHGDSLEPATPGSRPTGLVFDYAGRRQGLVILLK